MNLLQSFILASLSPFSLHVSIIHETVDFIQILLDTEDPLHVHAWVLQFVWKQDGILHSNKAPIL